MHNTNCISHNASFRLTTTDDSTVVICNPSSYTDTTGLPNPLRLFEFSKEDNDVKIIKTCNSRNIKSSDIDNINMTESVDAWNITMYNLSQHDQEQLYYWLVTQQNYLNDIEKHKTLISMDLTIIDKMVDCSMSQISNSKHDELYRLLYITQLLKLFIKPYKIQLAKRKGLSRVDNERLWNSLYINYKNDVTSILGKYGLHRDKFYKHHPSDRYPRFSMTQQINVCWSIMQSLPSIIGIETLEGSIDQLVISNVKMVIQQYSSIV